MLDKNTGLLFIRTLHKHDSFCFFPLSSGNLNQELRLEDFYNKSHNLSISFFQFIFYSLFPIDLFFLYFRIFFRKIFEKKIINTASEIVFSVGERDGVNDKYLGNINKKAFVVRFIPGSKLILEKDYFVESLTTYNFLIIFFFLPFLRPVLFLYYFFKLFFFKEKKVFVNLLLRNISSTSSFSSFFYILIIKSFLRKKNRFTRSTFPMEGRHWEKIISRYIFNTTGVIHSYLTPRHLWLTNNFYNQNDFPNYTIVPCKIYSKHLSNLYISKFIKRKNFRIPKLKFDVDKNNYNSNINATGKLKILILLNGNLTELKLILQDLKQSDIANHKELYFRPNPNTSNFKVIRNLIYKNNFKLSYSIKPDICLFRSSSIALAYMDKNIPIVYLKLGEFFSHNIFDFVKSIGIKHITLNDISYNKVYSIYKNYLSIKNNFSNKSLFMKELM